MTISNDEEQKIHGRKNTYTDDKVNIPNTLETNEMKMKKVKRKVNTNVHTLAALECCVKVPMISNFTDSICFSSIFKQPKHLYLIRGY